jgi:beta-glucosidase
MPATFTEDFVFGASTAAFQIEGTARLDGRGEGSWDRFSQTSGKAEHGDAGDVACDHYHRFGESLDLAEAANMKAYRLSTKWARVLPPGVAEANEACNRLVEACIARGIQLWV